MSEHSYGLDWIDEDALYELTKRIFSKIIDQVNSESLKTPPDPFAIVAQAVLFNQSTDAMMAFEKLREINKSLSNAVGNWHQAVLGLADGWENLGSNGGVVDLMVSEDSSSKPVAVEVKNRYNTIKASDEKNIWDKLDMLAKSHGSVAYLVQIVPKTLERYDRPWKVSGRSESDRVRCCDGATAYAWAFYRHDALKELYEAFPDILNEVVGGRDFDKTGMMQYFAMSIPEN